MKATGHVKSEQRLFGRLPLTVGSGPGVPDQMARFGFHALPVVGDTQPFVNDSTGAEAEWVRTGDGLAWLDYREVSSEEEQNLFRSLPRLRIDEVRDHLHAVDPIERRLGLRQAGLLVDDTLAERVVELTQDPDPSVAEDAKALCHQVYGGRLSTPQDAYRAFDATLDAHDRRQVLRWLMQDQRESNAAIEAVLQAALIDPDWEVRATAMIGVARFRSVQLTEQVATSPLPRVSRLGPVKLDRQMLFAIKQAVLWSFAGETLPDTPPEGTKPWRWWHIRRLVLGLPPTALDHAFVLVHSLTTPLPAAPQPTTLPAGVEETSTGYRLLASDIELAWVPPLPHWLGDEGLADNPLRRETPEGFFITRDRVRQGEVPLLTDNAGVHRHLETLSRQSGAQLFLPTPTQWETAARGPDGRRFPWGIGYESTWFWRASPWGVLNLFGEQPCWCGSNQVAGHEKVSTVATAVRSAHQAEHAALRPVVTLP
jgi:hypothetical protein